MLQLEEVIQIKPAHIHFARVNKTKNNVLLKLQLAPLFFVMTRVTLCPPIMGLFTWLVCSIVSSLHHLLCCGVSWLRQCDDDDDNYDDYGSALL